jgi:uncharacterized protein (TIGR02246 family)
MFASARILVAVPVVMSLMLMSLVSRSHAFQEAAPDDWEVEIKKMLTDYETAFNAKDVEKIGQMWLKDANYHDRIAGVKFTGREELTANFKKTFETIPGIRLRLDVTSVTRLKDDLVTAEGTVTMYVPDQDPTYNTMTAIFVKDEGKWVIASAEEVAPAGPPTASEALSQLDWLLGEWAADLDSEQTAGRQLEASRLTTTYRYSPTKTFLIRSFALTTQDKDEPIVQGTQIIGWDPRASQIRSWTFSSDGAFGEAFWAKTGEEWMIKTTTTLADGGAASGTYVMTRLTTDQITLSLIGQSVNGQPLPQADPITLTRQPIESAEATEK